MHNASFRLLSLSTVLFAACTPAGTDTGTDASSSMSSVTLSSAMAEASSSLPRETANVSYSGVIQPSGISIYMEGTHRLVLEDGRFLLLTSEAVQLNDYVGQQVDLRGAIRATVEGNGMIMRVESVTVIASSAASSEEMSSTDSSSLSSESMSISSSSAKMSSALSSKLAVSSSKAAVSSLMASKVMSSVVTSVAATSLSSSSMAADSAYEASTIAMAKDDLSPEKWTQRYCSSHIGFCFDVHKNWWYKSFGTTTNALWDVEISNKEIEVPSQGPIKVQLMSGELTGATDGQVKAVNGMAIGYRAWTEGRHFEISAPLSLQGAVTVITNDIAAN